MSAARCKNVAQTKYGITHIDNNFMGAIRSSLHRHTTVTLLEDDGHRFSSRIVVFRLSIVPLLIMKVLDDNFKVPQREGRKKC